MNNEIDVFIARLSEEWMGLWNSFRFVHGDNGVNCQRILGKGM